MTTTVKKDTYQVITDTIIEAMETRQVIPWRKTWTHGQLSPMNYYSGHQYRGINALLCALSPFATPYFLTIKQVNKLGGKVSKGAKSIPIVYWNIVYRNEAGEVISEAIAKAEGYARKSMFPRYYRVFNIEQVEGVEFELPTSEEREIAPHEYGDKLVAQMPSPPTIRHGGQHQPCYSPIADEVRMPERNQFASSEEYYCTLFHELVHSTGHESRLMREAVMSATMFGSLTYSQEELVAEIGATYLASIAGIDTKDVFDNSIAYLQGWIRAFTDDKKMLLRAASQARRAVEYITKQ